jgi:hypothetical protein
MQGQHRSRHSAARTRPPVLKSKISHGAAPASTRTILSLRSWESAPSTQNSADPRIYLSQASAMHSAFATISKKEMLAYTRLNLSAEFPDSNWVTTHQTSSWAQFNSPTLPFLRRSSLQMLKDALLLKIKLALAGLSLITQWTLPPIEQLSQILLDRFATAKQLLISLLILNNAVLAAYFVIHSEIWFANAHAAWSRQLKHPRISSANAKEWQI